MSELKLPAASGGGSISIKGPASSGSDVDLVDTSGHINLLDNISTKYGDSDELQIRHNSSGKSVIYHSHASEPLSIAGDHLQLADYANEHKFVYCDRDGAVELYYDNSKKWETTTNGCKLTGQLDIPDGSGSDGDNHIRIGNNFDLRIYHDGTHSYINNVTGELRCAASQFTVQNAAGNETLLYAVQDAGVGLKHNDNLKLETISTGVNITGGIRLGGNNSANEMDDYEEGTFTPRLGGASNIGTYNVTGVGAYVKIGNMVTVTFHFYDKDLNNNADGAVYIDQMPFTSKNGSTVGGISDNFHTEKVDFMEDRRYTWYISGNDTKLKGLYSTDGSGWANWHIVDFESSGMYIEVQCSYMTE